MAKEADVINVVPSIISSMSLAIEEDKLPKSVACDEDILVRSEAKEEDTVVILVFSEDETFSKSKDLKIVNYWEVPTLKFFYSQPDTFQRVPFRITDEKVFGHFVINFMVRPLGFLLEWIAKIFYRIFYSSRKLALLFASISEINYLKNI